MAASNGTASIAGWKLSAKNKRGWSWVPNFADADNAESLQLAAGILDGLGVVRPDAGGEAVGTADVGSSLERIVESRLATEVRDLAPDRDWVFSRGRSVLDFAQYEHLRSIDYLIRENPSLAVTLGRDYLIKPDVSVGIANTPTFANNLWLHAVVSCKWTIRSDRVQNVRHEFAQLIRHRRGRLPHLVTVTLEPLPTRLLSIARGTGEVDTTYHLAFDELHAAVEASSNRQQIEAWNEVVGQRRLRSFSELGRDLTSW